MLKRRQRRRKSPPFFVDADCHPQTIAVVATRAEPIGIEVVVGDPERSTTDATASARCLQYPGSIGRAARPRAAWPTPCTQAGGLVVVAWPTRWRWCCSTPPGELGADIAVGSMQRFGVPLGFGGPHAGFIATRDEHARVAARPTRGRVARRRRSPGAAAGAADPRAAHPPREGDEQHLHRAGAAGRDRRPCTPCGTGRTGSPDRLARAPPHLDPARGPRGRRGRGRRRRPGSTPSRAQCRVPAEGIRAAARAAGVNLRQVRCRHRRHQSRRDLHPGDVVAVWDGIRRQRRRGRAGRDGPRRHPDGASAHRRRS